MKALGGCFVIDDFGRQLVSPTNLLNRWIVPLESRIDYLKLHTGKSFSIPFEELVIFSTNLEPEDLMDPAFLRRLPYKIEVGAPSLEHLSAHLRQGMRAAGHCRLPGEVFEFIVHKLRTEKGLDLAAYQPRFIVDQVVATCRFMGAPAALRAALHRLCAQQSEGAPQRKGSSGLRPCMMHRCRIVGATRLHVRFEPSGTPERARAAMDAPIGSHDNSPG